MTNSEAFSATISWLVRITNQIPLVTSMYYSIGLHSYYPPATSLNPPLQSPLPVDPYPPTSLWLPYSLNFLWFNQFSFLLSTQNHKWNRIFSNLNRREDIPSNWECTPLKLFLPPIPLSAKWYIYTSIFYPWRAKLEWITMIINVYRWTLCFKEVIKANVKLMVSDAFFSLFFFLLRS